jgi:hypothetical protein
MNSQSPTTVYLRWFKEERERQKRQLEVVSSGACRLGYNAGAGWVDTTSEAIVAIKSRIAELDGLIVDRRF